MEPDRRASPRLSELKNLGPASERMLNAAGIHTLDDLETLGAVEAYRRVKGCFPDEVTRVLLYALQGALWDLHWNALPADMKAQLLAELGDA